MSKTCLVCGSTNFVPIYNELLLKCNECCFVTANLDINTIQLDRIYTESYFNGEEYQSYLEDKDVQQDNFRNRLKIIDKVVNYKNITNSLEIGCAYGFFAETLTNEISTTSYIGYDIVPEAIEYGNKVLKQNVRLKNYLDIVTETKFSDIFLWDVIEHLKEPDKFIEKVSNELQIGGRIYITTGDIDQFVPRIRKSKWRLIHPPTHLHYFSKKTLTNLLKKNNLEVIHTSYPSIKRSFSQIFYSLFIVNKKPSKFLVRIYHMIPQKLKISINMFDIMFVIAQKK